MNKILLGIIGIGIAMFLLVTMGGKENININISQPLQVDKLMPPNERIHLYFEKYSIQYQIPQKYIFRCAFLESGYKGLEHSSYAPYEDRLVSVAYAYGVLQVLTIAAREVWPQFNYIPNHKLFRLKIFSKEWSKEILRKHKYKIRYGVPLEVRLEYKSDTELATMLRYDLRFNIETGIKYMAFLFNKYKNYTVVYSVYNQGWKGAKRINSYARNITG